MLCSIRADVQESMPFHAHPPHELIVCLDEHGSLHLENERFDFAAGRTFLLPSGLPHSVQGSKNAPARSQFVCFDSALLGSLGTLPLQAMTGKRKSWLTHCAFDDGRYSDNLRLAGLLQQELDASSLYGDTMSKALLAQLLVNHLRHLQVHPIVQQNSRHFAIARCCQQILDDLAAPHCLNTLARNAGMSRSTFSLQFKQHTGLSLIEFIHFHRVTQAQRALQDSAESVTDIAFALGFGNLGHFYTVFRKQVGMTPCEYRSWSHAQYRTNNQAATPAQALIEPETTH